MIINWPRFLPRLAILFLVLFGLWLGQNSLIAWQIRSNIAKRTGAGANIGTVRADLTSIHVVLSNLRLYDPDRPERELFSADKITAQGNRPDILGRFLHFPEINIEGIQVEVEGTDGGELVPDQLWTRFKDRIPKELDAIDELDWTSLLTGNPEDAAKDFLAQLETSRLVADLKTRWPKEVQQFETAAALIRTRFENVKNLTNKSGQKVDQLQMVQEILKELEGADASIQELFNSVTQLRTKAQQDYQSITAAAHRDQEKIKSIKAPAVNTDKLSETLVGPEIRKQWEKTVAWGDWAASLIAPVQLGDTAAPVYERFGLKPPKRIQGELIPLTAFDIRPQLLIDRINMTGKVSFGTIPVFFHGAVQDIAYPPALGPEPTVAQFCFSGFGVPESTVMPVAAENVELSAMDQLAKAVDPNMFPNMYVTLKTDRIGENEDDTMIVCCPVYQLPQRTLGKEGKFAISVSPGTTRLDAVLNLKGERLSGEIRLVQTGVKLTPMLSAELRNSSLQQSLEQILGVLDHFVVTLRVAGTRSEPVYTVESNIGDVLRPQLENVLLAQWNGLRQKLDAEVVGEANQGLATLDSLIREKVDPVMLDVNTTRSDWEKQLASLSNLPLDQVLQSQMNNLSAKDRQRLENFVQTPAVQSLIQSQHATQGQPQLEQTIQQGVEKIQDKLPGLLDKLRKK